MKPAAPAGAPTLPAAAGTLVPLVAIHPGLDSGALLQARTAVQIAHNGFVYTLQATRLGKLILTK
ncbi:MAG: hemin uptake protein HemP [Pseudacidovorax sp.]|nr:hemin uptake protein HemP [Pseudacidovorax sp.]